MWALAPSRQRAEESRWDFLSHTRHVDRLHHGVQFEQPSAGSLQRPFLRKAQVRVRRWHLGQVQSMEQVAAMKAALEGDTFQSMGVLVRPT